MKKHGVVLQFKNMNTKPEDRVLTESERILNGLIVLCTNGYHCTKAGPGYIVSGGPVMKEAHIILENLGWVFDKYLSRWEYVVFQADEATEERNAGPENGEPV